MNKGSRKRKHMENLEDVQDIWNASYFGLRVWRTGEGSE